LGTSLINKLLEKAGKDLFVQEMYGLTETSPGALALNPKFHNTKVGSCGSLLPNTFGKIIDLDTGEGLGTHQNGELCIKGPQVNNINLLISVFPLYLAYTISY
jgi:long-chain acyl-CoA synthetase